jgi:hypothetical protein
VTGAAAPIAQSMQVLVQPSEWKHLTVNFDSGVR